MIEILDPAVDAEQIAQLLAPESDFAYVDGWLTAEPEYLAIERLASSNRPSTPVEESRYAVFEWRRTVVRLPDPDTFLRLRTTRNQHLITAAEQQAWSNARIGIAGLSVGASVLSVCALTGARNFRIADHDVLGPTNLNRLTGSVCDLGVPKITLAMRRTLELDPYSSIEPFPTGYSPEVAAEFFGRGATRLDVAAEEMDNLAMKVAFRRDARSAGVPVIMATDLGDGILLDVERYDLDPDYPLFHGQAGDVERLGSEQLNDPAERVRIAAAIVGDALDERLRYSLSEVGRSIGSWPQLGTAATLAGVAAAFVARQIVCGGHIPSGRYRIDIGAVLFGGH